MKGIPVIDLFAGPGGLGEGFSSIEDGKAFDIRLSIEKDKNAHKTLVFRSFYRQFRKNGKQVPSEYYEALREKNLRRREALIEEMLNSFPEGSEARAEAVLAELGSEKWAADKIDGLIAKRLGPDKKNWVLIGGPPCQAYSNAGRSRVGGIDPNDPRLYLYKEYHRIIVKHRPSVFVMENVEGLLSARVNEERIFDWIKNELQVDGEYQIHSFIRPVKNDKDYLIKAERFRIPQSRHRVIILGVRSDFEHNGRYLEEDSVITISSVIGKLPPLRSGVNRSFMGYHETEKQKDGSLKRLYDKHLDSDDLWLRIISYQIQRIKEWGDIPLNGLSKGPMTYREGKGGEFVTCTDTIDQNHPLRDWYIDKQLIGVPNHQSRTHLTQDLMRYMFAALYVEKYGSFPRLRDYAAHHADLIPDHANANSGDFVDRFRVQIAHKPATTVTSHISKDGHYFIHYDAKQCRSLTVREAARIQTFPDNYLFRGSRTSQFQQVGNAVPPYLAKQIGEIVLDIFSQSSNDRRSLRKGC